MEDKNKKVYDFIKGNLINAIVILISVAYVFYGMIGLDKTDLTIEEQIAKAGIGIVIGLLIKQGVGENGFNKGYNSTIWKEKMTDYSKASNQVINYLDRIDNFYIHEELEKKRQYRRMLLMEYRMKYEWFFNFKGEYVENKDKYSTLDKKQRRALKKAVKVKIYNLNLLSEYSNEVIASTKKEITDKNQRAKMFGKNGIAQIMGAIVGAYFLPAWNGWSWGAFIIASIQVTLWIFCGVAQLYTNYNYVVVEKTNKITRKMELLIKFKNGCEKGLYINNPYDEIEIPKENKPTEIKAEIVLLDKEVENGKETIYHEVDPISNI